MDAEALAKQFEILVSKSKRPVLEVTIGTTSALLTEEQAPMDIGDLPQTSPKGTNGPKTTEGNNANSPLDNDADLEMEDNEEVSGLYATCKEDVDRLQPVDYDK